MRTPSLLSAMLVIMTVQGCSDGRGGDGASTTLLEVRNTSIRQDDAELSTEKNSDAGTGDEFKIVSLYEELVHPIFVENCSGCHASRVSPYFADPDAVKSYSAILEASKVDFSVPANSRVVQRLSIEGHNCWSDCKENSKTMLEAVSKWVADSGLGGGAGNQFSFVTPEVTMPKMFRTYEPVVVDPNAPVVPTELVIEAEKLSLPKGWQIAEYEPMNESEESFSYITALQGGNLLTVEEIAEAENIPEFSMLFYVPTKGNYTLYARGAGLPNSTNSFFFRIDEQETWREVGFDGSGVFKLRSMAQVNWDPGIHTVTFRQKSANIRIDQFAAITRGPDQGVHLGNVDGLTLEETPISDRFLTIDVSKLTGQKNSKFVVAAEAYTEKSYLFTRPTLVLGDGSKAYRIEHIKPLINGIFTPQHTHWMGVETFATGIFTILTETGLPLIADKGPAEDRFSFAFELFSEVDPATLPEEETE